MEHTKGQEIDLLIERLSSSAVEFRNTVDDIVFKRLDKFFLVRQKRIARDSRLKDILPNDLDEADWYELENIGLKIPALRRAKVFHYLLAVYLIVAIGTLFTFSIFNLDLVFVVWGLPILGFIVALIMSPILLLMFVFKRRHFPCDTIEDLVDKIISLNWADLIFDDKKLFKELIRQEYENDNAH